MGSKLEKLYRIYSESTSYDGRKIPYLKKSDILKIQRSIGNHKGLTIYVTIKNKEYFIEIRENGDIFVFCEFEKQLDINELDKIGLFLKQEDIVHNVGFSERTGVIIEPKFSFQWILKMESFVEKTMNSVLKTEEIKFFPKKFKNTFKNWMVNIRDWNISRQLYWGHQIPVYFLKNDY